MSSSERSGDKHKLVGTSNGIKAKAPARYHTAGEGEGHAATGAGTACSEQASDDNSHQQEFTRWHT
jgi:hypothetical protein